jgi:hypothetical protein
MSAPVDTTTATTVTMVTMAELDAIGESIGRSAPLPPERTRTRETLMGLEALRVTTDVACREKSEQPPIHRASDPEKLPGVRPAIRHDMLISEPGVRPRPLRQVPFQRVAALR